MAASWHLAATVREAAAAAELIDILEQMHAAVAAFEAKEEEGLWRVDAYAPMPLLTPPLEIRLALAAAAAGGDLIEISQQRLAERDWVGENRLSFPPLRIGRFFIHGSHHLSALPAGAIGIEIDAATAFGTGEHPSTRGCLLALDLLVRRRRFHRPLDIGTGTGILAIAAAKRLHRTVVARDIDADAVRLAQRNSRRNGVGGLVRVGSGTGYRGRAVGGWRYDLVFANILARPLAAMARDLSARLAPGGRAVLSGLLRRQETVVLGAHRCVGLNLERRILVEGWSTLILRAGD